MTDAVLTNVLKTFNDGQVVAVDGIDLHIKEDELIVLVGPSGCGKSTTLRCIAGLETPDSGIIEFGGVEVTDLPPKDRAISMVFQNYALYPSMTVYENMAFGLKMRGADQGTIDEQVRWAANMMEIGDLLDRYPNQLSGGQQQRVALGRAIVRDPTLFLLDEPLSNLDAKLRGVMRTEIQELQKELGVATVFVTHDQEEAMSMGDRIAVMNAGRIEQADTPERIYHDPNSVFVADFIGSPGINFFQMTFDGSSVRSDAFTLDLADEVAAALETGLDGDDVIVGIRPSDIEIVDADTGVANTEIEVIEPMGDTKILYFDVGTRRVSAVVQTTLDIATDSTVGIDINRPNVHFFRPDGPKVVKWRRAVENQPGPGIASPGEVATDGFGDESVSDSEVE
jgi:multiple sugar transport system ATP-binding protein